MSWLSRGWQVFPAEFAVDAWRAAGVGPALAAVAQEPRRHGGTWCVGVDALPNDAEGHVGHGPAFGGTAYGRAVMETGMSLLHRGQISVMYPGYPQQDRDDSDANHRFCVARDATHLDGLLPEGPAKRRFLKEPHAWIIGVALTQADASAAPLVVWEGSHAVIRTAFARAFDAIPPQQWAQTDVTEVYKEARTQVFETCKRVPVPLEPGQSVLLHRMTLHGVAPWAEGAVAAPEGRAIAYFRPCFDDPADWLRLP